MRAVISSATKPPKTNSPKAISHFLRLKTGTPQKEVQVADHTTFATLIPAIPRLRVAIFSNESSRQRGVMRTEATKKLFTVDDYYRMADAGILTEHDRTELIEG